MNNNNENKIRWGLVIGAMASIPGQIATMIDCRLKRIPYVSDLSGVDREDAARIYQQRQEKRVNIDSDGKTV